MNKKTSIIKIIMALLALAQTIMGIIFVIMVLRYATFSKSAIIFAVCAILTFVLLIDFICYYGLRFKGKTAKIIAIVLSIIMIVLSSFGFYYLSRINKSIDNIINVDEKQKETSTVAFVTYKNEKIKSIYDINGTTKFGYINNESFIAGNVLALEVLNENNINPNMVAYDSYGDLILGLFEGSVEVAALPDNYYQMFSVNDGYEDYLIDTKTIHTYSKEIEITNIGGNDKDLTKDPFTVLLMGLDEQRTDSLMIATFNPSRMTVTMTSIARDSYVPIACYSGGARDKINHARTVSRQCTIDTVEQLMDVDIDFFVEINFYGIVDMVDAMGGLDLYSPVTFIGQQAGYENDENGRGKFFIWVGEGYLHRDGQQTLALARERHAMPGGDFDRQNNQQTIIKAMAEKMLNTKDINQILDVIEKAGDNIKTNFSLNQMSQLINFGIKMLNSTYEGKVDGVNGIFKFYNSRVTGYASWTYNESLSLPLWIYVPFKGSIADNKDLINRNLQINAKLRNNYAADFDTYYPYYDEFSVKDVYDEQREYQEMPDMMPYLTNGYTLEGVKAWLKERSWIKLSVVEVHEGDALYNANYGHNYVVKQSVAYGTKTANVKELTIWVIKHPIDCKIETYRQYDDCGYDYVVPEFVGMNYSELSNWIVDHPGVIVNITIVKESDQNSGYDENYANKVSYQSVEQWTMLNSLSTPINVTFNKKVNVEIDTNALFALSDKSSILNFLSNNGINYNLTEEYNESVALGSLIKFASYTSGVGVVNLNSDNVYDVIISKGSEPNIDVPIFSTISEYEAFCNTNGLTINEIPVNTSDPSLDGVKSQSHPAGTYKISQVEGISVEYYKYSSTEGN